MSTAKKEKRHRGNRRKDSSAQKPIESNPFSRYCTPRLGGIIEYLDTSCTAAVDGIKFSSDRSTIVYGDDLDSVDLESAYGDFGTLYSHSTKHQDYGDTVVGDLSTAGSHSTGSSSEHSSSMNTELSPKRTVGAAKANFVMIGRLHPRVPETNISLKKGNAVFGGDCSIVTAPTDTTHDSEAILANLQNSVLEEVKRELATAQRTRSEPEKSEDQVEPEASFPEPETTPSKDNIPTVPTVDREQEAAIDQGLQLCRRIQRSLQRPQSRPHQNGDSPALRGLPSSNASVASATVNASRTTNPAPTASRSNEDTSKSQKNPALTDQSPAAAPGPDTRLQQSTPLPPKAQPRKHKSAGRRLLETTNFLKDKIPFGERKASF